MSISTLKRLITHQGDKRSTKQLFYLCFGPSIMSERIFNQSTDSYRTQRTIQSIFPFILTIVSSKENIFRSKLSLFSLAMAEVSSGDIVGHPSTIKTANGSVDNEIENVNKIERKALQYTLWGNVAIALFGLIFAVWTRSEAIFLDGLFSTLCRSVIDFHCFEHCCIVVPATFVLLRTSPIAYNGLFYAY